jgi:transposase
MVKKVAQFEQETKRLKLFHLPPYSPELNPDEKVWRHVKHVSLKNHQAQDKKHLSRLVLGALRKIKNNPRLTKRFF